MADDATPFPRLEQTPLVTITYLLISFQYSISKASLQVLAYLGKRQHRKKMLARFLASEFCFAKLAALSCIATGCLGISL